MKIIEIDFSKISDIDEFYQVFTDKLQLPDYFGNNLDAIADSLSTDVEMPLHLEFKYLSVDQLEVFDELLEVFDDLSMQVDGFSFSYFLEQFDFD